MRISSNPSPPGLPGPVILHEPVGTHIHVWPTGVTIFGTIAPTVVGAAVGIIVGAVVGAIVGAVVTDAPKVGNVGNVVACRPNDIFDIREYFYKRKTETHLPNQVECRFYLLE